MKYCAAFVFVATFLPVFAVGQTPTAAPEKQNGTAKMAALLDSSGRPYSKVKEGVWQIDFTGDNVKQFPVRLAMADEILVVLSKLADRKDLALGPELLTKCMEMNHRMDSIKVALSEDMLYVRLDVRWRTLDPTELKYVLDQVSAATDEISPQLKPFLAPAPAK